MQTMLHLHMHLFVYTKLQEASPSLQCLNMITNTLVHKHWYPKQENIIGYDLSGQNVIDFPKLITTANSGMSLLMRMR